MKEIEIKNRVSLASVVGALLILEMLLTGTAHGEITRSGTVAEWHFDGDARDSSGNQNDGIINGATFVEGKFGKALNFNGVNNFVKINDDKSLYPFKGVTMTAWVKPASDTSRWGNVRIIERASHNPTLQIRNGEYAAGINADGVWHTCYVDAGIATANEWKYVAGTWDGQTIRIFVNGVLEGFDDIGCNQIQYTYDVMHIGGPGTNVGYDFKGAIDEVRIYNRALSAAEIKSNYEAGQIRITSNPSGAEVIIDGSSKGIASPDLSLYGISAGTYSVKCRLSGYQDYETKVVLSTSSSASVECLLKPVQVPKLSLSTDPPDFNLGTMKKGESSSRMISISNVGEGNLAWSVSDDQPWISLNPTSGTNAGSVTVNINTADLAPGSYTGNLIVSSNGGTSNGKVSLNVQPAPALEMENQQGSISIISVPSGAKIYLDGVNKGITPRTLESVSAGDHLIELTLADYKNWAKTITVVSGKRETVEAFLIAGPSIPEAKTSSILVYSVPSGAKIFLDGVYKGDTPKTIDSVTAGDHLIELRLDNYNVWTESITVESGKIASVGTGLTPVTATPDISDRVPLSWYSIIALVLIMAILGSIYLIRINKKSESDEDLAKIEEWKKGGYDVSELDRSLKGKK